MQGQNEFKGDLIVEMRPGEGGDDAKLLIKEQFSVYSKLAARRGL